MKEREILITGRINVAEMGQMFIRKKSQKLFATLILSETSENLSIFHPKPWLNLLEKHMVL